MMTCKLGLAAVLCVFVLMGCKKKDSAPEPKTSDAAVTDAASEPAEERADAPSAEEGEAAGTGKMVLHFTGNVEWVEPLGQRACKVIPVAADPRFAMSVAVEPGGEKGSPIEPGSTVVFAIHSPAKTFMTSGDWKSIAGHRYDFELTGEKSAEGQWSYYFMQAKSVK